MIRKVILHVLLKLKYRKGKCRLLSYNVAKDVQLGYCCTIGKKAYIDRNVKIGNCSYVNATQLETILESNTVIGDFCSIAPGVVIGMGNHHIDNVVTTHPILFDKYYSNVMGMDENKIKLDGLKDKSEITKIGSDVWLGARANIKRGISIGNGVVVAAYSVVTKDVPDYAIVAGIPAKVIGYRFTEEQRKILMINESKCFWNWEKDFLKKNMDMLYDAERYVSFVSK